MPLEYQIEKAKAYNFAFLAVIAQKNELAAETNKMPKFENGLHVVPKGKAFSWTKP